MFRWYDHWLKGVDTGVMDEPAVTVHVEGSREYVGETPSRPRRSSTATCTCGRGTDSRPSPRPWTPATPRPTGSTRPRSP